jgi:hypothetical protein
MDPDAAIPTPPGDDPPPSPAAAASNWRTVVAVDIAMGVVVMVIGLVLALWWQPLVGSGVSSLGLVYVVLAVRRASRWRAWRQRNGLGRGASIWGHDHRK